MNSGEDDASEHDFEPDNERPSKRSRTSESDQQQQQTVPPAYAPAYPFVTAAGPLSSSDENEAGPAEENEPAPAPAAAATAAAAGPQCSQHPHDFCFFCAYEKDPNAESGSAADLYGSLTDLVHSMSAQSKELPAIVDAVAVAYEGQIRQHICDPVHGQAPEWSRRAIQRHLTYSNQFTPVFDNAVTQVFHSLVEAQNRTLLDATTGFVVEDHRAAFMHTLTHYMKWQRFKDGRGGAVGRPGQASSSSKK